MTRHALSLASAACLLALLPAGAAFAEELPIRKAGLWEMKMVRSGGAIPETTLQHCTDAITDRRMSGSFSAGRETCSKQDIKKTASGYVSDSVCSVASMTITSHAEITGDFNSAYTVKSTAHSEGAMGGTHDSTTTIEAKWVGGCKADQKPGDIVMAGGMKMNVMDLDKFKAMMPKAK